MGFANVRRALGVAVATGLAMAGIHVGTAGADAYSDLGQQAMEYCRNRAETTSASTYQGVQVLYVHYGSTAQAPPASIRDDLLKQANDMIGQPIASGSRRVKYVYNSLCQVSVRSLAVSSSVIGDRYAIRNAIINAGFSQSSKKYIAFVDTTNSGKPRPVCGWTMGNVSLAAKDGSSSCWTHITFLHELFHQLGGVRPGAPHHDGNGHVTEKGDLLYASGGGTIDIGNDDYYHAGSIPSDAKFNHVRNPANNLAMSPWLAAK